MTKRLTDDPNGHGTLVAGVAAAAKEFKWNAVNQICLGVSAWASVVPIKVLDARVKVNGLKLSRGWIILLRSPMRFGDVINLSLGEPRLIVILDDIPDLKQLL